MTDGEDDLPNQIWVCDQCRSEHNDLILIGKWRLTDRKEDADIMCAVCSHKQKQPLEEQPH